MSKCYECKYEHSDCKGSKQDDCPNFAKKCAINYPQRVRELETELKLNAELCEVFRKDNVRLKDENFQLDNEWNKLRADRDEAYRLLKQADASYDTQVEQLFKALDRIGELNNENEELKRMYKELEDLYDSKHDYCAELKAENEKLKEENVDLRFETVKAFERGQKFPKVKNKGEMTIQEAIEWMIVERSTIVECDEPNNASKTIIKAFDMAIETLEKQIPEKPNISDGFYHYYICPACEQSLVAYTWEHGIHHCHYCGQAIDWSDTE